MIRINIFIFVAALLFGIAMLAYLLGVETGCKEARLEQSHLRAKMEVILDAYRRVDSTIAGIYDTKQTPLCDLSVCGDERIGGQ